MVAVTPSFFGEAMNLSLSGQTTVLPVPGPLAQSSLIALRCCVNTNVVPLLSARRTTVMSRSGSVTPSLALAISGVIPLGDLAQQDADVGVSG